MFRNDYVLDVSCKQVTDARLEYIQHIVERNPNFTKLAVLHLFDNRLTSQGMRSVCKLNPSCITTIWLGHNRISDKGIFLFVQTQWPVLRDLFLDENYIGDDGAQRITCVKSVRRLGLHTNCLTPEGVRRLERASYEVLWVQHQRLGMEYD